MTAYITILYQPTCKYRVLRCKKPLISSGLNKLCIYPIPTMNPITLTSSAAIHAKTHCHKTTQTAHFVPSSRLTAAIAATQGVYKRLNTSNAAALMEDIAVATLPPKRTSSVETTLSFAMNPLISAVQILQSPSPIGCNNGAKIPETNANILSSEDCTIFMWKSKLCKNHITTVASKITENARCRKSFAFSQSN